MSLCPEMTRPGGPASDCSAAHRSEWLPAATNCPSQPAGRGSDSRPPTGAQLLFTGSVRGVVREAGGRVGLGRGCRLRGRKTAQPIRPTAKAPTPSQRRRAPQMPEWWSGRAAAGTVAPNLSTRAWSCCSSTPDSLSRPSFAARVSTSSFCESVNPGRPALPDIGRTPTGSQYRGSPFSTLRNSSLELQSEPVCLNPSTSGRRCAVRHSRRARTHRRRSATRRIRAERPLPTRDACTVRLRPLTDSSHCARPRHRTPPLTTAAGRNALEPPGPRGWLRMRIGSESAGGR
ncbi:MAG: hypothetical protein QOF10_3894 [Kribbellaceae bacterium]|nr:hypothetical protein [Kribbellaceae bacterium]